MRTCSIKRNRKYKIHELVEIEEIYILVVLGKGAYKDGKQGKSRFPAGCWSEVGKEERGRRAVIYMLNKVLGWDKERICKELTTQVFTDNHLKGCLANVFDNSVYKALEAAFPGEFMPWELLQVPRNYWNKETGIIATNWLIEIKLKWSDEQIKSSLNYEVFKENGLTGMLAKLYHHSPYEALNTVRPGEFLQWELSSCPNEYWNEETIALAIRWLVLTKKKWTREEVCSNYSDEVLEQNCLGGIPEDIIGSGPYKLLNTAFPNEYMPWELSSCPQGFWKYEHNIQRAINWIKSKYSEATPEDFKRHGLGGLLHHKFGDNVSRAFVFEV